MRKLRTIIFCFLAMVIGFAGGGLGLIYFTLPLTEVLVVGKEPFYSPNNLDVETVNLTGASDEMSIHFLELGNKYTGDCTYIKVGDVDILIDCGSKSSSIATVTSYLNNYIKDNIIEYVIVTHAHMDHYAGFATSDKIKGIFDLYECKNIIDFGLATNQKPDSKTYKNYTTKRDKEIDDGATYYTSVDAFTKNSEFVLSNENDIKFEVLKNDYSKYNPGDSATEEYKTKENNYSVCTLFSYGERKFLFTGDLEGDGEELLVKNNPVFTEIKNSEKGVELYKAGHHGSGTSSTSEFLSYIRPQMVCVCCCAGSSEYSDNPANQFPTQKFIDNVAMYTKNVYVTTLCMDYDNNEFVSFNGNIVVVINSSKLGVQCSNNNTVLKDSDWFKQNRQIPTYWQ